MVCDEVVCLGSVRVDLRGGVCLVACFWEALCVVLCDGLVGDFFVVSCCFRFRCFFVW